MAVENMNTGKPFFGYFSNKTNYNNRGTNVDTSALCLVADEHAIYNRGTRFTGYDSSGTDVRTTYIKTIANNSNYLRYTKGDGTTADITVNFANNSTNATNATNVSVSNNSDNAYYPMCFVTSTSTQSIKVDGGGDFKYNPSTNILQVGQVKLNGSAATGCTMQYDASAECVKFVFA